ncbi:EAL domain-containing protein [Hoeflea poritis]|uniref:EAL domain-containing protein n=1 Tax=Hoeflea poritis TaxID=2993659 RepID=A0ABT4VRL3_9HYPH|nr:EAL domain-containing protein [Hoeflea poritis]MDA4847347.1 EAL domain-containing protein [Hoeflea poritis]
MKLPPNIARIAAQAILCLGVIWLQTLGVFDGLQHGVDAKRAELAPRDASGDIAFIAIDHESLNRIGIWPWPRSVHADLIGRLVENDVADILFDIDFSSRSTAVEDRRLLSALQEAGGSVVFPTFAQPGTATDSGAARLVRSLPHEMFRNDAWLASVQVSPDADGAVRQYAYGTSVEGEIIPSAAAILAGIPEMKTGYFGIDFSIDPQSVPTYSVTDLLSGNLPEGALRDKSIIVGAHAIELRDTFAVPVHTLISGPLLQVLAAETLLQNRIMLPSGKWLNAALVLLVLAVALLTARFGIVVRLTILAVLSLLTEAVGVYLQTNSAIVLATVQVHIAIVGLSLLAVASEFNIISLLLRISRLESLNTRRVLRQVFADSADGFLVVDCDGRILEINDNFRALFDIDGEQNAAVDVIDALPQALARDLRMTLGHTGDRHVTGEAEFHAARAETGRRVVEYTITLSKLSGTGHGEDNGPIIASVAARDVSVERAQRDKLEYLSKYDDLTGAMRRREYVEYLDRFLETVAEDGRKVTVVVINIHRFKSLNSTLGRSTGDGLLKAVADRLTKIGLPVSQAARLDADTFAFHNASELSKSGGRYIAGAVIQELSKPYNLNGMQVSADFYAGLSEAVDLPSQTADDLISNAELALDKARKQGGGGIAYYDPNHAQQLQRARLVEREMQSAVKDGSKQFWVAYQPQVHTKDGSPAGAEALLRWTHPELGTISPGEFIEIAEANGIIVQLGRWILNQACRDACAWPEDVTVSVNVSPTQLLRGGVVKDVREALAASGLPPHRLELELTESSFLTATEDLLSQLEALKALGVSLALDDFGTGYSSLGYIASFPVDKIKVDQTFMRGLPQSSRDQSVIFAAQVLGEGLGMEVLCEGVETEDQYQLVRSIGCHKIQGYLFGKPQTAAEIRSWFVEKGSSVLKTAV